MSIFKCKMCGGSLNINDNMSTAVCEYCGTEQTLPKNIDENKLNLYDRANHYRRNNDYDKAMSVYERILDIDKTDAEAYWSLVLCKYGIEYVEDPVSHKRVPTVNRTQFTSVFMDEDYKSAIQYADYMQKTLYEAEAKIIDEIQKGILKISQKEEPFDVFICYKESDSDGRRTRDSVIATELYHQLTKEGFKVFFSRITLEDKLGTAYEPYIFAALNSAKVMVVLGTKPEYFNAIWVKNEWSRYLLLIRSGAEKILIPAYRDMDPYDLPEEFSHLQSQDMSKLGFMQDLIRGIKKITAIEKPAEKVTEKNSVNNNESVEPIIRRAFLFLEDSNWQSADEYCERVLDKDPENALAYLCKLMIELKVPKEEQLANLEETFETNGNYIKAVRFADAELRNRLKNYINAIENKHQREIYDKAVEQIKMSAEAKDYDKKISYLKSAIALFEQSGYWDDSKEKIDSCNNDIKDCYYNEGISLMYTDENGESLTSSEKDIYMAIGLFEKIEEWKDSRELISKCQSHIVYLKNKEKDEVYSQAMDHMQKGSISEYKEAIKKLETISVWKDSSQKIEECNNKITELRQKQKKRKRKRTKKGLIISAAAVAAVCIIYTFVISPLFIKQGWEYLEQGSLNEAVSEFEKVYYYPGLNKDIYKKAKSFMENGNYGKANILFTCIKNYSDAEKQADAAIFIKEGWEDFDKGYLTYAASNFKLAGKFAGDSPKLNKDIYKKAKAFMENGDYAEASILFSCIKNYSDAKQQAAEAIQKIKKNTTTISTDSYRTVGIKSDGTVVATGENDDGECDVENWKDIISVSTSYDHTVGLKSDGTVVATGANDYGKCDVENWKDIISVYADTNKTVGLKSDGTVVTTWDGFEYDAIDWENMISSSVVKLKSDGTVDITNDNDYYDEWDVSDWNDIIAVTTGQGFIVGLKSDGTVVATGNSFSLDYYVGDVSDWNDIIAVSAGAFHTVGLKSDGTVVATGENDDGQCDVENWKNMKTVK